MKEDPREFQELYCAHNIVHSIFVLGDLWISEPSLDQIMWQDHNLIWTTNRFLSKCYKEIYIVNPKKLQPLEVFFRKLKLQGQFAPLMFAA